METLALIVAGLVTVALVITRINARYEKPKPQQGDGDDRDVELLFREAWDDFAADEPLEVARARINKLQNHCEIADISHKTTVVQFAVMAARAERIDLLPALAERAEQLDRHCGETKSLRVLSELYHGNDIQRAKRLFEEAQQVTAGCSSCSASLESKLLGTEISVAAELFEQRISAQFDEPARDTPHGSLTLRRVAS
jgi:hypothetical protein